MRGRGRIESAVPLSMDGTLLRLQIVLDDKDQDLWVGDVTVHQGGCISPSVEAEKAKWMRQVHMLERDKATLEREAAPMRAELAQLRQVNERLQRILGLRRENEEMRRREAQTPDEELRARARALEVD